MNSGHITGTLNKQFWNEKNFCRATGYWYPGGYEK